MDGEPIEEVPTSLQRGLSASLQVKRSRSESAIPAALNGAELSSNVRYAHDEAGRTGHSAHIGRSARQPSHAAAPTSTGTIEEALQAHFASSSLFASKPPRLVLTGATALVKHHSFERSFQCRRQRTKLPSSTCRQ